MKQLRLSGHSLDMAACPARYFYYRQFEGGRSPVGVSPALAQGIAGHGYLARWRRGESEEKQRAFPEAVYAAHPPPADDFRQLPYLFEALTQYKAEFPEPQQFELEEVEKTFERVLGVLETRRHGPVEVLWTGRRDAVVVERATARRFVLDNKFTSRDQTALVTSSQNSGALKGYCWAYADEHKTLIHGAMLRRVVIRKPTKTVAFNFSLPLDPPFFFPDLILQEWRAHTLLRAAEILERHPDDLEQWPMVSTLCQGPYGCCDFLDVCLLPPTDRPIKLRSDAFRPAAERETYDQEGE